MICALALRAGAVFAATAGDGFSMPSAREYFFASAYVQVCSGGSAIDTPALRALREQTVAYYHTQFGRDGEDAETKRIIGRIEANVLPGGLVEAVKEGRRKKAVPDGDLICRTFDAFIRRQFARHDLAMAEQGWPGAKPVAEARDALRSIAGERDPADAAADLQNNPKHARPARINADVPVCAPYYPAAAARIGAMGVTTMRFDVDANGQVTAWDLVHSAGDTLQHGLLDFAAVESLSRCPFEPGRDADGKTIPTTVTIEYSWRLD